MILLVLLLVFFAVTVSLFFSRRFLSPIHREITEIRAKQAASAEEAVKIKQDLERLAPKVRNEIDDDSYAIFKENLKKLTPKEKEVFGLVMSGHSSKEITEIEGFTINALKYHNRNIYSKLGVSSKKELLKYSTLVRREGSGTAPLN
jgi:DNA-binding CsgD family transcriptional regulator